MIQNISHIGSVAPSQEEARRATAAVKAPSTPQTTTAVDSLEISQEALRMKDQASGVSESTTAVDEVKSERIKRQIASGFYNNPAVLRAVALKIAKSFQD